VCERVEGHPPGGLVPTCALYGAPSPSFPSCPARPGDPETAPESPAPAAGGGAGTAAATATGTAAEDEVGVVAALTPVVAAGAPLGLTARGDAIANGTGRVASRSLGGAEEVDREARWPWPEKEPLALWRDRGDVITTSLS
jgi:hypothetical protein